LITLQNNIRRSGSRQCNHIKPYIREAKLIKQSSTFIDALDEENITLNGVLKAGYYEDKKITSNIIQEINIDFDDPLS
jgi:hypothetical protein